MIFFSISSIESSYLNVTNTYGVVLIADSHKFCLNIGSRSKNRQNRKLLNIFRKVGFLSDMILVVKIVIFDPELVVSEILGVIRALNLEMRTPLNRARVVTRKILIILNI